MDELPALVTDAVGDATVIESVDLGGGDRVVVTPAETHLYRSEGLLSDESVETFNHDVEALAVDSGRRKLTVRLAGMGGEQTFTVPAKVGDAVVEAVLEGVLRTTGVLEADETIADQFRFSELTVVVTDRQLLKHVGDSVWNEEHETFPYEALTDLAFEEGSVNTQIVVRTGDRQERLKVSTERAVRIRDALQSAVFEYYDVASLAGLREALEPDAEPADERADRTVPEIDLSKGSGEGEETVGQEPDDDGFVSADWSPPADQDVTGPRGRVNLGSSRDDSRDDQRADRRDDPEGRSGRDGKTGDWPGTEPGAGRGRSPGGTDATERGDATASHDELAEHMESLVAAVEYQTELLERQQETIDQLVEELRRGR